MRNLYSVDKKYECENLLDSSQFSERISFKSKFKKFSLILQLGAIFKNIMEDILVEVILGASIVR